MGRDPVGVGVGDALDEALAVLDADDLGLIVRRLIIDVGPVNRWT